MKIGFACVCFIIKNELPENDGPVWNSYLASLVKSASTDWTDWTQKNAASQNAVPWLSSARCTELGRTFPRRLLQPDALLSVLAETHFGVGGWLGWLGVGWDPKLHPPPWDSKTESSPTRGVHRRLRRLRNFQARPLSDSSIPEWIAGTGVAGGSLKTPFGGECLR